MSKIVSLLETKKLTLDLHVGRIQVTENATVGVSGFFARIRGELDPGWIACVELLGVYWSAAFVINYREKGTK